MATTAKPATFDLSNRLDHRVGSYTLTPIPPEFDGHVAYLVSVDEEAARFFGTPVFAELYADTTIGSLCKVRAGWAVVAYRDRDAYVRGQESGWYAPFDPSSRVQGVRILALYWRTLYFRRDIGRLTAKACAAA